VFELLDLPPFFVGAIVGIGVGAHVGTRTSVDTGALVALQLLALFLVSFLLLFLIFLVDFDLFEGAATKLLGGQVGAIVWVGAGVLLDSLPPLPSLVFKPRCSVELLRVKAPSSL
jgi:hypothetical protein